MLLRHRYTKVLSDPDAVSLIDLRFEIVPNYSFQIPWLTNTYVIDPHMLNRVNKELLTKE